MSVGLLAILLGVPVTAIGVWLVSSSDDLDGWRDWVGMSGAVIGSLAAVMGVIGLVVIHAERSSCVRQGALLSMPTRYIDGNIGCQIEVGGAWTPYDRWVAVSGQR